uniref:Uncharacterized protein n=1 Tax=Arundo donax TaxID=35708 RepID=A0A0A9FEK1_ARUDO
MHLLFHLLYSSMPHADFSCLCTFSRWARMNHLFLNF